MKTSVRTGIVAVAGAVALGTIGFGASAIADGDDAATLKRDDTTTGWVQSTDLDDDPDGDDVQRGGADSQTLTNNTRNTVQTVKTAPTKNTAPTVNTAPTNNTVNTAPTTNTGPTQTNNTQ